MVDISLPRVAGARVANPRYGICGVREAAGVEPVRVATQLAANDRQVLVVIKLSLKINREVVVRLKKQRATNGRVLGAFQGIAGSGVLDTLMRIGQVESKASRNVEVMRGPQGTTFGRNATLGLIHFVSARPTDEFDAVAVAMNTFDGQTALFATNELIPIHKSERIVELRVTH